MSFFAKVKGAGLKTKIKGEIALIDRESKANRSAFGVELFDLLDKMEHKNIGKTPMLLGTQSQQVKQVFDACVLDVRVLQDERDAKRQEIEHLQVNRERATPVYTTQEKLARAGDWVASNSKETQRKAEMALLDRKIRQAKEKFGQDVFELVTLEKRQEKSGGLLGGMKDNITNTMSKLSPAETKIQECIRRAEATDTQIQSRRSRKEREILRIEQETE